MIGADVEALRRLALQFDQSAQRLRSIAGSVSNGVQVSAWVGPVALRFRHTWDSEHSVRLRNVAEALDANATLLRQNAAEQERASSSGTVGEVGVSKPAEVGLGDKVQYWAPANVEGIVAESVQLGPDGLRIQTLIDADGNKRHIVYIGGTGAGGNPLDSSNLHDAYENVAAFSDYPTQTENYIREQMEKAGIGQDSEVLFVGYSQGGIHAQNLARSGDFGDSTVVTVGSPQVPGSMGGVDILRLEQRGDIVVERAGIHNHLNEFNEHVGIHRETGVDTKYIHGGRTVPLGPAPDLARGIGTHVDHDGYREGAAGFDRSQAEEHVAFRKKLERFTGSTVVRDTDPIKNVPPDRLERTITGTF